MKFLIRSLFLVSFLVLAFNGRTDEGVTLIKQKGDVFVDNIKVKKDSKIPFKSIIRVEGDKSFAVVRYPSGSVVLFKKGEAKILMNRDIESISLIKGAIFVFVKKLGKALSDQEKFTVNTPKVSMGVRGTKFLAQHDDEGSYLCVCEGVVDARSGKNQFSLNKGEDLWARPGKVDEKISKANSQMMTMAKEGFALMGHPVK
jgi:hypothetical protein